MAITAALVKELRTKSGAGMMDCKKALAETDGNLEAAVDWLRKKGLASAQKKSGRVAAEGLVAVNTAGTSGAVIEVNAETDFVGRNEQFQGFVAKLAELSVGTADVDALKGADYGEEGRNVEEQLTHLVATIGENMSVRRLANVSVEKGAVVSYIHSAVVPGMGKIGVLVGLESDADAGVLEGLGKQIAMHIAATSPKSLDVADLDQEIVEREKTVLREQALASGKPAEIVEKMIGGRINKFYEEVVLLEQAFVIDGKTKVKDAIVAAGKEAGADIKLVAFERYALGEGIEKKEENFAEEVAKTAAGG